MTGAAIPSAMAGHLAGKVALITGASRGIAKLSPIVSARAGPRNGTSRKNHASRNPAAPMHAAVRNTGCNAAVTAFA